MAQNDNIWNVGQIAADTITSGTLYTTTISGNSTFTWPPVATPPKCFGHVSGEWREEPNGVFSIYCQLCGEQMTVTLPEELVADTVKDLLTRVILGDIDDDLRAAVSLANEQIALVNLLLAET